MKIVIVVIVLIGMGSVAGSIIVGKSVFEGIVVDSPYERGLEWDKVQREREASGWTVKIEPEQLRKGDNDIFIHVRDKNGNSVPGADVTIFLSRPSTHANDALYKTIPTTQGTYRMRAGIPLAGHWDIEVTVAKDGKKIPFTVKTYVR